MRAQYTDKQLAFLRTWYRRWKIPQLTLRFNARFGEHKTEVAIKSALTNYRICCGRPVGNTAGVSRLFTERQAAFIRNNIGKYTHAEITKLLNRRYASNFTERQIHFFTRNHGITSGRTGYFAKGHTPWNTGTKGLLKSNSGTFRKGNVPANSRPSGAERIDSKDGYVLVKINERNPYTGAVERFKAKHVVLWEKKHGKVPAGSVVIFRDGNKYNFSPDNLVCISRAVLARLNKMHYKEQNPVLKPSIMSFALLVTKIGEVTKNSQKGRVK